MPRAGRTVSIYLSPEMDREIAARVNGDDGNRSATIAAIVGRYAEVCRRSMPDLSEAEVNCVRDALNGTWLLERSESLQTMLWAQVDDACRLNGADTKWRVDRAALVSKLRRLTYAQVVALVDDVERFWAKA